MRALRVVGITEGGGELSVVLEDSVRQERFTVPADEQLRAAARGDLTRLGQIAIELESQLRPREIQARIRAGASVDQVAAAAGVPSQKIERFAYPVLLERSRTAEVAQRAHPMRADGPDNRMLGDVVAHTFGLRGQEFHTAEWDSWKGEDGRWVVALSWRAGRSDNRALWTFQPGAHGGTVTAIDEHAHDLVEGLPARPLRTVGPVIDISRPDEQPPPAPEEGHELRAAASDIAARRDVSDWSRVAPEPRRPESRRTAGRPEPGEHYARPGRADEPATEWPAPQRQSESTRRDAASADGRRDTPANGSVRAETAATRADGASPASDATRADAAQGGGATRAESASRADGGVQAERMSTTSGAPAARSENEAVQSERTSTASGAPAARSENGAAPSATAPGTVASSASAHAGGPSPVAGADTPAADGGPGATDANPATEPAARAGSPQAEAAVPSARSPEPGSAADGATDAATSDEPPAPRKAEPEAPPTQQAPKRTRKGKPVMPSWDEVLLGVRSQR